MNPCPRRTNWKSRFVITPYLLELWSFAWSWLDSSPQRREKWTLIAGRDVQGCYNVEGCDYWKGLTVRRGSSVVGLIWCKNQRKKKMFLHVFLLRTSSSRLFWFMMVRVGAVRGTALYTWPVGVLNAGFLQTRCVMKRTLQLISCSCQWMTAPQTWMLTHSLKC